MNFRFFRDRLKGIAIARAILDLIRIPVNLLSAGLLAGIVMDATAGDTSSVWNRGLMLALLFTGYQIFETICRIRLERSRSKTLQVCKLELYDRFLSGSLASLYASESGQMKERLTDDFGTAADRILTVYPGVCVGLLTGITYFIFIARLNWLLAVILTVLDTICMLLILFAGALMVSHGTITAGEVAAMAGYFGVYNTLISKIGSVIRTAPDYKNDVERVTELYSHEEKQDGEPVGDVHAIEVKELGFCYGEHPVFKNVTFSVRKGDKFAVTGANGSGKSTLILLLCGLLENKCQIMSFAWTRRACCRQLLFGTLSKFV